MLERGDDSIILQRFFLLCEYFFFSFCFAFCFWSFVFAVFVLLENCRGFSHPNELQVGFSSLGQLNRDDNRVAQMSQFGQIYSFKDELRQRQPS